jgi:phosphate transport system permease protein
MTKLSANYDQALLKRRYGSERRFRAYGIVALVLTVAFLAYLVIDILIKAVPAFHENYATLDVTLAAGDVDPANIAAADFAKVTKDAIRTAFPEVSSRTDRRKLASLISNAAGDDLRSAVRSDPSLIGKTAPFKMLLSDSADLYLKGQMTSVTRTPGAGTLNLAQAGDDYSLKGDTTGIAPGHIIRGNKGALRVKSADASGVIAEPLLPLETLNPLTAGQYDVIALGSRETERNIDDKSIVWLETLKDRGAVSSGFAWRFFYDSDSREAEVAGLRGAIVGSLLTVMVTLLLSVPLGIAAAIYLEQFAPQNRWTQVIEVNINNLAAVPSIIFGLLGLAVFLNFFGMPRSAPLVGGFVLALLVLPTIIIASRAALKAVPPSIKEAALGVGASDQQAVFQHVLPLALPGILTGIILGVARAFGETAPLLMIGMVAFIADVPKGFTDAATVLPVQIFLWSDLPERAFVSKTAAAIIVLLVILFCLNAVAIYLRKKFERRW